ncbi:MAG: SAVED domain-containing protein [Formivibrio sp.]|nr:SAVED domain-containing protein [Formivibrio sp.]
MPKHLYENWCDIKQTDVASGRKLYLITEKAGVRAGIHGEIVKTVHSHYEDPRRLAARIRRLGFNKASKIIDAMLPKSKTARSGHLGEIFATEVVPAVLPSFRVPIKRLRWLDGRESALRGEDVIGIACEKTKVRFLKGESKSGVAITPTIVAEARAALKSHHGRPSQHAMAFIMQRLFDQGDSATALIFEEYLLTKTIPVQELVHMVFALSGNDASTQLQSDLKGYSGNIEQYAVNLRIEDHQKFIRSIYVK